MESFFLDYKDPLFSFIVFFFIVFIISFANYWWGVVEEKRTSLSIKQFFHKINDRKITASSEVFTDSKILINFWLSHGMFPKVISHAKKELVLTQKFEDRQFLMNSLAYAYLKAGFLHNARDTYIQSLKVNSKDINTLTYLLVIYDKLKDFENARDILMVLGELGDDTSIYEDYMSAQEILYEKKYGLVEKEKQLHALSLKSKIVQRIYIEFVIQNSMLELDKLHHFDWSDSLDLLWKMDKKKLTNLNKENALVSQVLYAKGFENSHLGDILFELDIVRHYDKSKIDFKFACKKCSNIYPFAMYVCPNCSNINTMIVKPLVVKA